jgi:predicted nucleotidyltransferase component of viral defense system
MIFPSENKEVFHEYSDGLSENPFVVPCYSLKEVLSEKLRALIQRSYTAPRDYYDIWHLSNSQEIKNWDEITDAFNQKMEFKNIPFEGVHQMINENNDKRVGTAWKNSLAHQIPGGLNISYEEVRNHLFILLSRIFEK